MFENEICACRAVNSPAYVVASAAELTTVPVSWVGALVSRMKDDQAFSVVRRGPPSIEPQSREASRFDRIAAKGHRPCDLSGHRIRMCLVFASNSPTLQVQV
jgi:hypothetical protein